MKLVLASSSARRAEILANAGFTFDTLPTSVSESRLPDESAEHMVRRLAEAKVRAAAAKLPRSAMVIGADTVVRIDDAVLGKPASAEDARAMLRRLSGRTHEVLTGLAVMRVPEGASRPSRLRASVETETTRVSFAPLTSEEIDEYVASGEPMDKAGAYGIQGRGGRFVTGVEGCYFNVVGLPLARLYRMLREFGWREESGVYPEK